MTKPNNLTEVLEQSKARLEQGYAAIYKEMHYEKLLAAFEASMALNKQLLDTLVMARRRIEYLTTMCGVERHVAANERDFLPIIDTALTAAQAHGVKEYVYVFHKFN